jgi:hypothetical protein
VPGLGALADVEAAVLQLAQAVVAPVRDPVQPAGHPLVPCGWIWQSLAVDLRLAYRRTRVPAQPGDALHRLTKLAVTVTGEPDVPVIELVGHRHPEPDAQPADEVFLLVTVEDEGVDHTDAVAAGVEVDADGERQPLAAAAVGAVPAVHADHRAHRPALLHGDLPDLAGKALLAHGTRLGVAGMVLAKADQGAVGGDRALAPGNGRHQYLPALGDPAADNAGVDIDCVPVLDHPQRGGGRSRFARAQQIGRCGRGFRADRMGGPLDGAVRPEAGCPGLHRYGVAVAGGQA